MALTDWTQQRAASSQNASTTFALNGDYSYLLDGNSNRPIITLDQSATDSPTEGKIVTEHFYQGSNPTQLGLIIRFQDTKNYYKASFDYSGSSVYLSEVNSGNRNIVDQTSISKPADASWSKIEAIWWEDSGVLNLRPKINGNGQGDLSDSTPTLSTGGAMGFEEKRDESWLDETEVFY